MPDRASGDEEDRREPDRPGMRERVRRFWARHRTLFWVLHSVWALATGVAVIVLAHERYGFLPWVVVFLVLTWASTMYFGRRTAAAPDAGDRSGEGAGPPSPPPLLDEVTSYLNRIMYQETLFFLLPFYAYSTVFGSLNVLFIVLLAGLAVVACLDLVFDRWLRASAVFGLVFFATVAFAGFNLVIPMLGGVPPRIATPLSAVLAVSGGAALALRRSNGRSGRVKVALASVVILAVVVGRPDVVPPVPLRLESAVFAPSIDRNALTPSDTLGAEIDRASLHNGLVVLVRVFAPAAVPARVSVEWKRDGATVRTSREIGVVAHSGGFRIWDALRPGPGGLEPGRYEVVLWTVGRRVFGVAEIDVRD